MKISPLFVIILAALGFYLYRKGIFNNNPGYGSQKASLTVPGVRRTL